MLNCLHLDLQKRGSGQGSLCNLPKEARNLTDELKYSLEVRLRELIDLWLILPPGGRVQILSLREPYHVSRKLWNRATSQWEGYPPSGFGLGFEFHWTTLSSKREVLWGAWEWQRWLVEVTLRKGPGLLDKTTPNTCFQLSDMCRTHLCGDSSCIKAEDWCNFARYKYRAMKSVLPTLNTLRFCLIFSI